MSHPKPKGEYGWERGGEDCVATYRYFDRQFSRNAIKILPGEYLATREDLALVTVLGSCVAACIRDPIANVGGMNHFMLPDAESSGNGNANSARYGSFAMEVLVNEILKRGGKRDRLEAKVFGGGNVLRGFTSNQVGTRNVSFVKEYLDLERIPVVAADLGHNYARKVCYLPLSGQAFMRRLDIDHAKADLASENDYGRRITRQPVSGGVELFD